MEPTVKLRLGDLFDGPADLIVLPCSTAGTITGFVARSLVHYSIPHPQVGMSLGEVEILPFEGADDIAQYVAFAASVKGNSSTPAAIESIGRELGLFTKTQSSVRNVSAPLLGAGAGGLQSEKVVAALRNGFSSTAAADASLVIHVLHQDVYERLKGNRRYIQGKPKESVRVFIGDLASLPPDSTKYQVVVRAQDIDKGLPMYLRTRYAFHAPGSEREQSFRDELLKELLDLPLDPSLEARECTV